MTTQREAAEPVAWMDREGDIYRMPEIKNWAPPHTLLYTEPPECNPLTNEQLAAPELLAALQGMLRGIFDGPDDASAAMLIAKARAAIAKAKGEKE